MVKRKKIEFENEITELETSLGFFKNRREIAEKIKFTDEECPICHSKDIDLDPNYQINHIKEELQKIDDKN